MNVNHVHLVKVIMFRLPSVTIFQLQYDYATEPEATTSNRSNIVNLISFEHGLLYATSAHSSTTDLGINILIQYRH